MCLGRDGHQGSGRQRGKRSLCDPVTRETPRLGCKGFEDDSRAPAPVLKSMETGIDGLCRVVIGVVFVMLVCFSSAMACEGRGDPVVCSDVERIDATNYV